MLTSTFDDTQISTRPATGTLDDEALAFRRMQVRDRRPAWIAPAAGVALIGGVAAMTLLTSGPGRDAEPADVAGRSVIATEAAVATAAAAPPIEAASLSASVDPVPAAAPVRPPASDAAPIRRPTGPSLRPPAVRPSETVTGAPAEAAPSVEMQTAPPTAPAPQIVTPPAAETPVAPATPLAPADTAPADAAPMAAPNPAATSESAQ